ncbi:MAG: hypothetical protein WBQ23_07420 [Bacteroidota bacterium]
MFRYLLFLAMLLPALANAQAPTDGESGGAAHSAVARRFDPAVFFSTVIINQMYGQDGIDTPAGMRKSLVDSIWANERPIGFSIRLDPESGEGWQMWLDYDADVYYRPRLFRLLAQRPMAKDKTDAFETYRDWVAAVQKDNIGAVVKESPEQIIWPWLTRTSYFLTLKMESLNGVPWLLLVLQREEM